METLRLFDLLPRYAQKFNKPDMLVSKVNGKWVSHSSEEVSSTANFISYGLFQMGIQRNDKISITITAITIIWATDKKRSCT
jgi:long-subunit acyl-CoA synthetase (AMP-forming)